MFRLIGAMLVIASTAAWGICGVIKLRKRAQALRSVTQSLDIMKSEICDKMTPVPELMAMLSKSAGYPANVFYQNVTEGLGNLGEMPFAELWSRAVCASPVLQLNPQEVFALSKLGYSIGRYDPTEQKAAIEHTYTAMCRFAEKAEEDVKRDSKVRAFTGIAAGIFTVIILA